MFAGAARAAVFSNPEVIRRVNAEFVPVALKAALVNNPPGDAEGQLYQEIARSEPERQGICVVNSAGKVLDWTLTFDDDQSVHAFLDHALQRFHEHPDATRSVVAERYVKYPSLKLPDIPDSGQILAVPDHHAGTRCPAQARFPEGTIIGRVFGRALGPDGTPVADTIRQEQYIEDRFELPVEAQELLARELSDAGAARFELPREIARLFASHAYLGQLDVNPLGSPAGGSGVFKTCEFWAQRVNADVNGPVRLRVEGQSEIAGSQDEARPEEGGERRVWQHKVKLAWVGFIEMRRDRVTQLLLAARGFEKLKWGRRVFQGESEVSHLPAGRPIEIACAVRYGIMGERVAGSDIGAADPPASPAPAPDALSQLLAGLGPQGAILVNPVIQYDLHLSGEQRQKLQQAMRSAVHGFQKVAQDAQGLPQRDRQQKLSDFRREANQKLGAALANVLKPAQLKRFRQVVLQQQGLFALGDPEVAAQLKVSHAQRAKLMIIAQQTQRRIQAVQQSSQSSGNPGDLQHEAAQIRSGEETKIARLLTSAQQKQWKAMLGRPLLVSGVSDLQAHLQRKIQQIQAGLQRWQTQGRDPTPVGQIMRGFDPLMREGRFNEAEAVLDHALQVLGETEKGGAER